MPVKGSSLPRIHGDTGLSSSCRPAAGLAVVPCPGGEPAQTLLSQMLSFPVGLMLGRTSRAVIAGGGGAGRGPERVQRVSVPSLVFLVCVQGGRHRWVFPKQQWVAASFHGARLGPGAGARGAAVCCGTEPVLVADQGGPSDYSETASAFFSQGLRAPQCVARLQAGVQGGSRSLPRALSGVVCPPPPTGQQADTPLSQRLGLLPASRLRSWPGGPALIGAPAPAPSPCGWWWERLISPIFVLGVSQSCPVSTSSIRF